MVGIEWEIECEIIYTHGNMQISRFYVYTRKYSDKIISTIIINNINDNDISILSDNITL